MSYLKRDFKKYIQQMDFKDYSIIDSPWSYNDKPPHLFKNQLSYSLWNDNYNDLKFIFDNIKCDYIFLWITNSLLDVGFKVINDCSSIWKYKTCVTWNKLSKNKKLFYGLGNTFRNSTEQLLVLSKIKKPPLGLNLRTTIMESCGDRTIKPKKFESELINILNLNKNFKGCYLFCGKKILNLDIENVDILNENEIEIYNENNEIMFED